MAETYPLSTWMLIFFLDLSSKVLVRAISYTFFWDWWVAAAPERPHQDKQLYMRFIEKGKGKSDNGKRRGEEREEGYSS